MTNGGHENEGENIAFSVKNVHVLIKIVVERPLGPSSNVNNLRNIPLQPQKSLHHLSLQDRWCVQMLYALLNVYTYAIYQLTVQPTSVLLAVIYLSSGISLEFHLLHPLTIHRRHTRSLHRILTLHGTTCHIPISLEAIHKTLIQ